VFAYVGYILLGNINGMSQFLRSSYITTEEYPHLFNWTGRAGHHATLTSAHVRVQSRLLPLIYEGGLISFAST